MNRKLFEEAGVVIPLAALSQEALQGLVEEFVSRDGTDTGDTRRDLDSRVAQVMGQLRKGSSVIVFDEKSHTANIVSVEARKFRSPEGCGP